MNEKTSDVSLKNVGKGLQIPKFLCTFARLKTKRKETKMKTISEKEWAEVFGVETPAENTTKSEKNTAPIIGIPGVLDDDDSNIEGVCVMDFSGFRDFVNENSI